VKTGLAGLRWLSGRMHQLRFVGRGIGQDIMMDIVDLHFVEDIDGVTEGGIFRGFDNDFEPGGVGAMFLIEEDGADGMLVDGFSVVWVFPFIIVDAVVLAEE